MESRIFVGGVVSCLVKPRPPVRAITDVSFDVKKMFYCIENWEEKRYSKKL